MHQGDTASCMAPSIASQAQARDTRLSLQASTPSPDPEPVPSRPSPRSYDSRKSATYARSVSRWLLLCRLNLGYSSAGSRLCMSMRHNLYSNLHHSVEVAAVEASSPGDYSGGRPDDDGSGAAAGHYLGAGQGLMRTSCRSELCGSPEFTWTN